MKQLNKYQNAAFLVGGLLMTIGAAMFVLMLHKEVACWIFFVGAIAFTLMQSAQTYEGTNIVIKRLKRIQSFANLLFVLAAILMVDSVYQFLLPLFTNGKTAGTGYLTYVEVIYNKWVLMLLIAAILEIYTTHRLDSELRKEKKV